MREIEQIIVSVDPSDGALDISGLSGYETVVLENNKIGIRPKWIKCSDSMPEEGKVLAIYRSKKDGIYNMRHDGWFRDTIYSCWMKNGRFIIESHGPELEATHWMPLPNPPEKE